MTADEWLADLEAKAKAYKSSSTYERLIAKDDYFAAANPATVLRLVAMVRWLAGQGDYVCPPEKFRTVDCPEVQREEFCPCKRCWAEAAYNATEASHD